MLKDFLSKCIQAVDMSLDGIINNPDIIEKSGPHRFAITPVTRKTYDFDPNLQSVQDGYVGKYTTVPDTTKFMIYLKEPVVSSIIATRINQITEFSRPQRNKYTAGFLFRRKDGEDTTPGEKDKIELLNNFILRCGKTDLERTESNEECSFEEFLKLETKDTLIYDSVAIERIPTFSGKLHHFIPTSAPTIRFASRNYTNKQENDREKTERKGITPETTVKAKYIQVINGIKEKSLSNDELIYKMRNPVNDISLNGYSIGELDLLMNTITAHLNLDKRNKSLFENSFTSPGIINFKGDVSEEQLEAFRRAYYSMGVGPNAMYKNPIMNAEGGVEFLRTNVNNSDMEFGNLADYLIKLICAVYQTAPEEINFSSANSAGGNSSGGQNYNNLEARIGWSKDKGLRPLLRFFENLINDEILPYVEWDWAKDYEFAFVGFDDEDRKEELDRQEKEVKTHKTVDEIRKERGEDPLPNGLGECILDSVWLQFQQAKVNPQQPAMGQQPGQETPQAGDQQEQKLPFESQGNEDLNPEEQNTDETKLPFEKSKTPILIEWIRK